MALRAVAVRFMRERRVIAIRQMLYVRCYMSDAICQMTLHVTCLCMSQDFCGASSGNRDMQRHVTCKVLWWCLKWQS